MSEELDEATVKLIDAFEGFLFECEELLPCVTFDKVQDRQDFKDALDFIADEIRLYRHRALVLKAMETGKAIEAGKAKAGR